MKIWVVGATGMLGTALCVLLQKKNIGYIGTNSKLDISSQSAIDQFLKENNTITHIVNCAAYTQVDKAEEEKELAHAVNATGPENLARAAKTYGIHLTHISTDYVFDGKSDIPYQEESSCNPLGVYGYTKWEGEQKLLSLSGKVCIIRTSWLFGLNGKNFVSIMLELMKEREVLTVVADQMGCPTYCDDLAEGVLALLDQVGIFHFANSGATSRHTFASAIAEAGKLHGYPIKVKSIIPVSICEYPTPAKRPLYSVLDTTKVSRKIKYTPRSWQDALAEYLIQLKKEKINDSSSSRTS